MSLKLKSETIIKLLVVFYFTNVYVKAYLSISIAPVLDVFLFLVLAFTIKRSMLWGDLMRLSLVLVSGLLIVMKLSYGISFNTISLMLTSRAPFMIFTTIFLAMYYVRLQPDLDVITRFIEKTIAVLVVFIVLEGVYINYFGTPYELVALFGKAGYSYQQNSPFFKFIAQGLVPGPQHASIISCAGIILFFPFGKMKFHQIILFVLSIVGLSFSVTNTALMSLLIAIIIGYFVSFRINISSFIYGVGILVIFLFISNSYVDWLTIKYDVLDGLSKQEVSAFIKSNIDIYMSPINNLKSLPWSVLLTGVGHSGFEANKNLIYDTYNFVSYHADFGFLVMVLEHGLIYVLMLMSLYTGFLLYIKKNIKYVFHKKQRIYLIKTTAVVSLFFVSAVHYVTPTKGGLMQIIVLLAAITLITIKRYIYLTHQSYKKNRAEVVV